MNQLTFSLSLPSNFLSSRFDNFPGATVIGKVVENIKILPEQFAPYHILHIHKHSKKKKLLLMLEYPIE
jgi:hypothetical protein